TWALLRRIADRAIAGAAVVLAACASPFVYAHALLVHYELLPWPFLVLAMLCLGGARLSSERLETRRLLLAALCLALALSASIKAIFLAAPLFALSARLGVRWARVRPWQWALMISAVALPLMPMIAFAIVDPAHGLSSQVSMRLDILSGARLEKLVH